MRAQSSRDRIGKAGRSSAFCSPALAGRCAGSLCYAALQACAAALALSALDFTQLCYYFWGADGPCSNTKQNTCTAPLLALRTQLRGLLPQILYAAATVRVDLSPTCIHSVGNSRVVIALFATTDTRLCIASVHC